MGIIVLAASCATPSPPSAAPAPTTRPAPTSLPVAPTLGPAPTLSPESEGRVLELLKTNAGCDLPCWWGIVPGQTSWAETRKLVDGLGARTRASSTSNNLVVHTTGGFDLAKLQIYNRFVFVERSDTDGVETIKIRSFTTGNLSGFQDLWASYSPKEIMSKYGQPQRVWLQSGSHFAEPPTSPIQGYELMLFYDDLGFLIHFAGLVNYEPVYRFCPEFGSNGDLLGEIHLVLRNPSSQTPLEEL